MTPAERRPADVIVVIDTLRATSTLAEGLATGYRRVLVAESIDRARGLRAPGRVLAGERQCIRPAGFDQGNSPLDARRRRGDELVLATTNGAPAIVAASLLASHVMLACMLNLGSVVAALLQREDHVRAKLQILCSATGGQLALEDVYVAGRLSAALPPGPRSDAALAAEAVARAFESPFEALNASAHARVLRALGASADIAHCACESALAVVPVVVGVSAGVAVVAARGADPAGPDGPEFDRAGTVVV